LSIDSGTGQPPSARIVFVIAFARSSCRFRAAAASHALWFEISVLRCAAVSAL
jgi:hypothetical protein